MPLFVPSTDYGPAIAALTVGNKRMPNDVVVNASSSPVDLTGLTTPILSAGLTYSFEVLIVAQNVGTGGYKIQITADGSLTATNFISQGAISVSVGSPALLLLQGTSLGSGGNLATSGDGIATITLAGTITVNVAGTFTVQGAQNSGSGSTTFKRGSYMRLWGPY